MPLLSEYLDGAAKVEITHLTEDSRTVKPGSLFAAFKGTQSDGYNYIEQAIKQGASAILTSRSYDATIPVIVAQDPRSTFDILPRSFMRHCREKLSPSPAPTAKLLPRISCANFGISWASQVHHWARLASSNANNKPMMAR